MDGSKINSLRDEKMSIFVGWESKPDGLEHMLLP
jgi:hypothetical protein